MRIGWRIGEGEATADREEKQTVSLVGVPTLPFVQGSRVIVQLVNEHDTCWEAIYSSRAQKNKEPRFKDKSD